MSDRRIVGGTAIAIVQRAQSPAQIANLRPFQPGRSGNPLGRRKGSRNKLSQAFVDEVCASFEQHGREVIDRVRREHPVEFLKIVAALIPKAFGSEATENPIDELSDSQIDFMSRVLQCLAEAEARGDKEVTVTLPV